MPIEALAIDVPTFLPGITINAGKLIFDETKLLYPGDLLHEAGHLAVLTPEERAGVNGRLPVDGGGEMAAIAWSYAGVLSAGLAPEVLFHEHGYRDGADALLENFAAGRYIGVPLLQWMGLTIEPSKAALVGHSPYPHMIRWLRSA